VILAPILLAAALSQVEPAPAPAAAAAPTTAAPAALGAAAPRLSGYLQADWSSVDAPGAGRDGNTFELRRARLQVAGEALALVSYKVEADVAEKVVNHVVKDAWIGLRLLPGAELRFGQFKTPFGYEQTESDTRLLWVNGSYVVAGMAHGPDSRDLGLGVNGAWTFGERFGVEVAAAVVNGAGPDTADELIEKNAWARVGGSLTLGAWKARAGFSYGYGRQLVTVGTDLKLGTADDVSFYFHRFGGDLEVDSPWLFAVVEGASGRHDTSGATGVAQGRGLVAGGYGKTPWGAGPVVRYDWYAPFDKVAGNDRQRLTLGAYYDLRPVAVRLAFNYDLDLSDAAAKTGNVATLMAQVLF
jgi:hypothetical protein